MSYHYTPLDPLIWLIFAGFLVFTFLIVKIYHRKYPSYPQSAEKDKKREHNIDTHVQTESKVSVEGKY